MIVGRVVRDGRVWTLAKVPREDEAEADFLFWFQGMTGDERVLAVRECVESSLAAKGVLEIPRFRRVHRLVERKRKFEETDASFNRDDPILGEEAAGRKQNLADLAPPRRTGSALTTRRSRGRRRR